MFTLDVNRDLKLELINTRFAPIYLDIVTRDQEYLSQWLVWPPHAHDEAFFLSFIKKSLHDYAEGKSLVCGIIYQGQLVGSVSYNTINQSLKKVEIGYWLSSLHQGKGIVSQAVAKLIELAFTQFGMEKVQISAATENTPSRKVCERLGFTLEGVIRRAENLNGRIVDHAIYGLDRATWKIAN
ncbi:ribosomal-protein-L7/L12-serine acetyltransferase [Salinivibrio sp. PR5]|uniref:GNAT family N-acetyltransferase n=1 Tax=Salinivibrio sp. PR5 TaxID=1909484 RepID=UPI000989E52F|nr:GNAT family protein [Salinivibrio sp. PR5]OOF09742.1 ribosomal-protein-L7/L12-serine acetyltransferase [Salinivibrio sp. PR5]